VYSNESAQGRRSVAVHVVVGEDRGDRRTAGRPTWLRRTARRITHMDCMRCILEGQAPLIGILARLPPPLPPPPPSPPLLSLPVMGAAPPVEDALCAIVPPAALSLLGQSRQGSSLDPSHAPLDILLTVHTSRVTSKVALLATYYL